MPALPAFEPAYRTSPARKLAPALILSAALHLALLATPATQHQARTEAPATRTTGSGLEVRLAALPAPPTPPKQVAGVSAPTAVLPPAEIPAPAADPALGTGPVKLAATPPAAATDAQPAPIPVIATDPPSDPPTESPGLPPPPPRYFARAELDQGPRAAGPVVVPYPDGEDARRVTVRLELCIAADGRVDSATVTANDGPPAFAASAIASFAAARFAPGRLGGVAVPSRMRIEVGFAAG